MKTNHLLLGSSNADVASVASGTTREPTATPKQSQQPTANNKKKNGTFKGNCHHCGIPGQMKANCRKKKKKKKKEDIEKARLAANKQEDKVYISLVVIEEDHMPEHMTNNNFMLFLRVLAPSPHIPAIAPFVPWKSLHVFSSRENNRWSLWR
jgi:hypothetical protein